MSITTCPKCGSPLRPGARFCGVCGENLPVQIKPAHEQPAAAASAEVICPHCGKPVRLGARFCQSCGKPVEPAVEAAAETVVPSSESLGEDAASMQETRRVQSSPGPSVPSVVAQPGGVAQPVQAPPPISASGMHTPSIETTVLKPTPAPARPRSKRSPKFTRLGMLLGLFLILGCVAVALTGAFLANRLGWIQGLPPGFLSRPTDLPTVMQTQSPVFTEEVLLTVEQPTVEMPIEGVLTTEPPVEVIPTIEPTQIVLIEETVTPVSSVEATVTTISPSEMPGSATLTVSPAVMITPTASTSATDTGLLIDELFDQGLRIYWKTWGEPRAIIRTGPTDNWLYLKAMDPPQSSGVTSRTEFGIYNMPGLVVEFSASLDPNYPASVILFDWDPRQFNRGPENIEPGLIHLEIRNSRILLETPYSRLRCNADNEGSRNHIYRVQMTATQGVDVYVDDQPTPLCQVEDMGLDPLPEPGAISFSGAGWVTYVKVTAPQP